MSSRHFEGYLPTGVELLEDDTLGTSSGNPTSNVVYGFRRHKPDEADRFAIVKHEASYNRDRAESLKRRLIGVGPLKESQYTREMSGLLDEENHHEFFKPNDDKSGFVVMEATVPRLRTSELIVGHLLEIIFVKD
jgi:hypothetical protein